MNACLENSKNEKVIFENKKTKKNIVETTLTFAVVLVCLNRNPKTKKLESKSSIKLVATSNWLFSE